MQVFHILFQYYIIGLLSEHNVQELSAFITVIKFLDKVKECFSRCPATLPTAVAGLRELPSLSLSPCRSTLAQ